jgi:hypothetical protein
MYFITGRKSFRGSGGESGMRQILIIKEASGGRTEFYFPAMA